MPTENTQNHLPFTLHCTQAIESLDYSKPWIIEIEPRQIKIIDIETKLNNMNTILSRN